MPTDTSERGLETLIVEALTGLPVATAPERMVGDDTRPYGGVGYVEGDPADYDRDHAVGLLKLFDFLNATQPRTVSLLGIGADGPPRQQFLHRLQGEIARRGVVDVLRNGVKHG